MEHVLVGWVLLFELKLLIWSIYGIISLSYISTWVVRLPPSTHPAARDGFMQTMPPRASLTSSFSVTDANNEVVCPLKNNDGSNCRKRCLGVSISPIFPLCVGRSIGAPLPATPAIAAVRRFYRAKRPAFHVYLSLLPYPPVSKLI